MLTVLTQRIKRIIHPIRKNVNTRRKSFGFYRIRNRKNAEHGRGSAAERGEAPGKAPRGKKANTGPTGAVGRKPKAAVRVSSGAGRKGSGSGQHPAVKPQRKQKSAKEKSTMGKEGGKEKTAKSRRKGRKADPLYTKQGAGRLQSQAPPAEFPQHTGQDSAPSMRCRKNTKSPRRKASRKVQGPAEGKAADAQATRICTKPALQNKSSDLPAQAPHILRRIRAQVLYRGKQDGRGTYRKTAACIHGRRATQPIRRNHRRIGERQKRTAFSPPSCFFRTGVA